MMHTERPLGEGHPSGSPAGAPLPQISIADFQKVDIRVGRVVSAEPNQRARKPAYIVTVDFGPLGIKKTSAQISQNYRPEELVGRSVLGVLNLPPKNVADVTSEFLLLGALSNERGVILIQPEKNVESGSQIA